MRREAILASSLLAVLIAACGGKSVLVEDDGSGNDGGIFSDGGSKGTLDGGAGNKDGGATLDSGATGPITDGGADASTCADECAGECVSADDPHFGCGAASCGACPTQANSVPVCNGTTCGVQCNPGYSACATGCCTCGDTTSDPTNCGFCGHNCGTATCTAGVCTANVFASAQVDAYSIAVDDTNVYWTVEGNGSDGAVMKQPLAGGDPVALAPDLAYPSYLAVDANNVYFATYNAVNSVPIAGGAAKVLESSQTQAPTAIAVSGASVYYIGTVYQPTVSSSVLSIPVTGGTATTLVPTVTTTPGGSQAPVLGTNGSTIYFSDSINLLSVPAGGGATKTVESQSYPYAVYADSKHTFYASGLNGGAVLQASTGGGPAITLAANQLNPNAIVSDGTNVYFTTGEGGGGTVMRVPIGGGTPTPLATGQGYPTGIAVNSTQVFWVNFGTGTINSVPK